LRSQRLAVNGRNQPSGSVRDAASVLAVGLDVIAKAPLDVASLQKTASKRPAQSGVSHCDNGPASSPIRTPKPSCLKKATSASGSLATFASLRSCLRITMQTLESSKTRQCRHNDGVDAPPDGIECAKVVMFSHPTNGESIMEKVASSVSTCKRSFQAHALWLRRRGFPQEAFRRKVLAFFAEQPRCVVAMEACGSAHHWRRLSRPWPRGSVDPGRHVKRS